MHLTTLFEWQDHFARSTHDGLPRPPHHHHPLTAMDTAGGTTSRRTCSQKSCNAHMHFCALVILLIPGHMGSACVPGREMLMGGSPRQMPRQ